MPGKIDFKRLFLVACVSIFVFMFVGMGVLVQGVFASEHNYAFGADRQGTWYVIAAGWSKIIHDEHPAINVTIEATAGANANMQLIEKKNIDLGVVMDFNSKEGYMGAEWAKGETYTRQRSMFPLQVSYLHIVTLEKAGLNNVSDFHGRIVCCSPQGSSASIIVSRMLDALQIKPKKLIMGSQAQNFELVQDGQSLGAMHTWGLPAAAVEDIGAVNPVKLISLTDEQVRIMQRKYPLHAVGVIPAGTYKWQKEDVNTIFLWSYVVCDKSLPEEVVYKMVKTTFESYDKMRRVHTAAEVCIPENFTHMTIPLHPGAARYYREKGFTIPENLLPVN